MKVLICAAVLSLVSIGAAFAQAPSAPAKMSADDKKAISKTCSDQANAKGLHGKDRKKFRVACIKNGGKSQ
jgi:outer membrane lipoprotein-sorting protein